METLIVEWPMKLEPASPLSSSSDEIFLLDGDEIVWPGDGCVEVIESDQASLPGLTSPEPGWLSPDPNEEFHLPWELIVDPIVKEEEETDDSDSIVASPPTRGEMASKMLEDLDNWIKEEPFTVWLEDKIELPLLADLPPAPEPVAVATLVHPSSGGLSSTQTLLQEFQSVFDQVSTCHDTPPQSPETVDAELAAVDALVRDRAERLVTAPDPVQTVAELPTVTSNFKPEVPASPSSSSSDEGSDPDWQPAAESSTSTLKSTPARRGRAPRSKPYAAAADERRQRKKEQNKNAATRYRQKKKAEVEEILSEERILEIKNNKLRDQLSEIGREVKYLKGLMRDLCRAKGLIK